MQVIDLTPYLPRQEAPAVRSARSTSAFVAVVESIVTAAIGLCFFAGVILFVAML